MSSKERNTGGYMKKAEVKELAKRVVWFGLDALECTARESWLLEDLTEEEKDAVEKKVFEMIASLQRRCKE